MIETLEKTGLTTMSCINRGKVGVRDDERYVEPGYFRSTAVDESLDESSRGGDILNEGRFVSCEGPRVQTNARHGREPVNAAKGGATRVNRVCSAETTLESGRSAGERAACRAAWRDEEASAAPDRRGETNPACFQCSCHDAHGRSCHEMQLPYIRSELRRTETGRREHVSSTHDDHERSVEGYRCTAHSHERTLRRNGRYSYSPADSRHFGVEDKTREFNEPDTTCSKFVPLADWKAVVSRQHRFGRGDCTNRATKVKYCTAVAQGCVHNRTSLASPADDTSPVNDEDAEFFQFMSQVNSMPRSDREAAGSRTGNFEPDVHCGYVPPVTSLYGNNEFLYLDRFFAEQDESTELHIPDRDDNEKSCRVDYEPRNSVVEKLKPHDPLSDATERSHISYTKYHGLLDNPPKETVGLFNRSSNQHPTNVVNETAVKPKHSVVTPI